MRRACLVFSAALILGCGPKQVNSLAPSAAVNASSLRLVALEPPAGSIVTKDTVIRATLTYTIARPTPFGHELLAQFQTTTSNQTFGVHDFTIPRDKGLSDTATVEIRMADVWKETRLQRPFRLQLMLNEVQASGRSRSIAVAAPLLYPDK